MPGRFDMPLTARLINLTTRPDRLECTRARLVAMGVPFTVFSTVKPDHQGAYANPGIRGCAESHLTILREAAANGNAPVLIIEDDVLPCHDFASLYARFNSLISSDLGEVDLVYYYNQHTTDDGAELAKVRLPTVGTHFYLAANPQRILSCCDGPLPIDFSYYRAVEAGSLRAVSPNRQIVMQDTTLGTDVDLNDRQLAWKVDIFRGVYVDSRTVHGSMPGSESAT